MKILILILLLSKLLYADWSIEIGIFTSHLQKIFENDFYNENNDLIGIRYKNFSIATMENSYFQRSFIFSYHYELTNNFSFITGVVTGYDKVGQKNSNPYSTYFSNNNLPPVIPILVPNYRIKLSENVDLNVRLFFFVLNMSLNFRI